MNSLKEALFEVHKAYSIVHDYQKRILSIIQQVKTELPGFNFLYWSPYPNMPAGKRVDILERFASDMLPLGNFEYVMTNSQNAQNEARKGDILFYISIYNSLYDYNDSTGGDYKIGEYCKETAILKVEIHISESKVDGSWTNIYTESDYEKIANRGIQFHDFDNHFLYIHEFPLDEFSDIDKIKEKMSEVKASEPFIK